MKKANSRKGKEGAGPFKKGKVFSLEEKLEEKLSMRFRYWRGWMIEDLRLYKGVVFPSTDREYVNRLKKKVISDSSSQTLLKLLKEAPWTIKESWVAERVYQLQHKTQIQLKQIGVTRGITNPTILRDVIEKDINSFKELVAKRLKKKTVQDITNKDSTDALVWRRYIKPARVMLKAFGSNEHSVEGWEDVFKCFEAMGSFVGHEHPNVCVLIREKDPKILLFRADMTIKDGFTIYHP